MIWTFNNNKYKLNIGFNRLYNTQNIFFFFNSFALVCRQLAPAAAPSYTVYPLFLQCILSQALS